MLDVPVAIAMVALIVGMGAGALLVFVSLHQKIERLQTECRNRALESLGHTGTAGRS